MSYPIFTRYVLMVHNTLTGQQLGLVHGLRGRRRTGALNARVRLHERIFVYICMLY